MITAVLQLGVYWLTHVPLRFLTRAKVEVDPEAFRAERPLLLAANHDWRFDSFLLALLPYALIRRWIPLAFPTGAYFEERTYLWRCLRLLGAFRVPRLAWSVDAYLEGTRERIARGDTVLIFPEGRITTQDAPRRAKKGIGYLLQRSEVTVVPLKILISSRFRVAITVGKPIPAIEIANGTPADAAQRLLGIIETL